MPRRLLLFAATTGYQIRVFGEAARRIGAELTLATDRCHVLEDPWGDRAIPVRFDDVDWSLAQLTRREFDGVAAVGDGPAVLAAEAARALGVEFHPPEAARACQDKFEARTRFRKAGMRVPDFRRVEAADDTAQVRFPCVLKPTGLSGSRGVIRANSPAEFAAAWHRIRAMGPHEIQVEEYIDGREFAVEGLMTRGRFEPLAIFDKPDPLEGPFFEETIYVTPSRQPEIVQRELIEVTRAAARALGLWHGPVHVELRFNDAGAWVLEAHARPIGGLCAKALKPLEELILRHALGEEVGAAQLERGASGVMMIPIPKSGLYQSVEGVERAAGVAGIEDVIITAQPGQKLQQLPEGSSYLGFLFARGNRPEAVEAALREAHGKLRFHIATALETLRPSS
jgi:biotin carboxylase